MLKKSLKYILIFTNLCFVLFPALSQCKNIGLPILKNFKRSEYQAGMQSWMISQASNELMYFANNDGLMEFDGQNWKLYRIPDGTIVRSVFSSENGKIYIGGSNNFGYFEKDLSGELQFTSLLKLLPVEKRDFGDIWKIHNTKDGIVFQSYKQLIIYNNNKTKVYTAPNQFHFSFYIKEKLYVVDNKDGIFELNKGNLKHLKGTEDLNNTEICSILPFGEMILIATTDNGVYSYNGNKINEWENATADYLKKNQIYCAIRINEEHIAFGTIQQGLIISTNEGTPVLIMDESKGLQNNTILCMKTDVNKNLWLGTDNGIDLLYINLPVSFLNHYQNLSAGYTAVIHKNILYLGTNRGLFYKRWDECNKYPARFSDYELIESTKGQVWKLQVIDDHLFCGHNSGTYIIEGTVAKKISDIPGAWTFLRPLKDPDKIIVGTYVGLILFQKTNGKWTFSKKIAGFEESSRIMEFDNNESIWMSHGFKGVFNIRLNETYDSVSLVKFYDSLSGFNTNYGIDVTKLKNQIIFLSPNGIFRYNESYNTMEPSKYFNELFSNKVVNRVVEDESGDIWYFADNNIAVKRAQEDGSFLDINLPFKHLQGKFIGGFQFVYPISHDHVLFGYENGFIHYDTNPVVNYQKPFNVFLNQVKVSKKDSILLEGHIFTNPKKETVLRYQDNGLHFFFSAVSYDNPEKNEFSTFLEGYDNKWSDWEIRHDREFTNLKEGNYAFYVKARNIYNVETKPLIFEFTIAPPWTRTKLAYLIYGLILIILIIFIYYFFRKRLEFLKLREEKLQRQKFIEIEQELQREAIIAEKEIIKLRNDKLRQEMKSKNKELADSTMQTIQKNRFLKNLKKDMNQISTITKSEAVHSHLKKLISKIDKDINNENNWKVFETHFGNVHEEFLLRLKQEYPQISPAELRLSACLRMNISSKEIADLLNISLRGVEASRYRLRKTLNLDRQINLTDFILSY